MAAKGAAGGASTTFSINVEGNASSQLKDVAGNAYTLKERMSNGTQAVREMTSQLKSLKGSTEDVKAITDELKAKIASEKSELSKLVLENIKAEGANIKLAKSAATVADEVAKATQAQTEAAAAAAALAAAEVASIKRQAQAMAEAANAAKSQAASVSSIGAMLQQQGAAGIGEHTKNQELAAKAAEVAAKRFAAVALAAVAIAAAVGAATAAFAKFVVSGADAVRTTNLLREAAMGGNAEWGKAFGSQIDALTEKLPTAKAEVEKLGLSLWKQNISGQTWVDSMGAISQASAALGEDSGAAVKELITANERMGRLKAIRPRDLLPTGIAFAELAAELAKSSGKSIEKAKGALRSGLVPLGMGAEALRKVIEKKFGAINLKQAISLPALTQKFHENLRSLTSGVNLEPMLIGFKSLLDLFSSNTVSGVALKQLFTTFGDAVVGAMGIALPAIKTFFQYGIIAALKLENAWLSLKIEFERTINDMVDLGLSFDWSFLKHAGGAIIDGLIDGIKGAWGRLADAMAGTADVTRGSYADALDMHSPSRVFKQLGRYTVEGYAEGVNESSPQAQAAVNSMITVPSKGGGGGGGGRSVTVNIAINASGAGAHAAASAASTESMLEQITRAVVDALQQSGIPVTS